MGSPAEQVNEVIDKVADKLGDAANAAAPLCQQVIQEYQNRQLVFAAGLGLLAIIIAVIGRRSIKVMHRRIKDLRGAFDATITQEMRDKHCGTVWRKQETICNAGAHMVLIGLVYTGGFVACVIISLCCLADAMAPTLNCLKMLVE